MPQAIFAYHLGMDAEQYAFFRIPKLLITEPYFRRLSTDAKLLYGLMLDRMSLSMRNGWMDDDGHVYIYFTLEEACEQLCCKTDKAVKLFAELDSAKGVGLIRRVKQGLGRPAKIYVLRFMGIEDEPGEDKLIPPLLDAVDAGTLKFVPAADFLSHLSEKEQTYLLLVMERDEVSPSLGQAQRLKQLSGEGKLENNIIDLIMREEKPLERKVTIRNDRLQKYFPASYTPKQMEDVIIKLLEGWHRKRQQEMSR